MKLLTNGCSRSKISVTPKNWQSTKADVKRKWKIHYRFYDPAYKNPGQYPRGKQVVLCGMNEFVALTDRQKVTRSILENEIVVLDHDRFNPITGLNMPIDKTGDIDATTPLCHALEHALTTCRVSASTRIDMRSVVKYFIKSAALLKWQNMPVKNVQRKHVRKILDNCENLIVEQKTNKGVLRSNKIWTTNQFNHYRKYLIILFNELEELEIVEYNPVEKIAKKETVQKIRTILTHDERRLIDKLLLKKTPSFHRFVNIFFHSGARLAELCRIQGKDVDLINQRFKVIIVKSSFRRETWKTIKDVALPFWTEAMSTCRRDQYVFSAGLMPGQAPIRPEQITRRWKAHVKSQGITADLYSLKHLNTTETVDQLGEIEAARQNSHTSTAMVVKIYDVKQAQRKHDKLKKAPGKFA